MKSQPVVAEVLERLLEKHKQQLKEEFTQEFATKRELREMEERMDVKAKKYRDDVLTKMDEIVGELAQMREDRLVGDYQTKERLEHHEERIVKLEKHPHL